MSVRYEWVEAKNASIRYVPPTKEQGNSAPVLGIVEEEDPNAINGFNHVGALIISLDEATVIEGTPEELH